MRQIITSYSFNAAAKQVDFSSYSGFVLQFSQANNLNLEVVMYNLLNTVIGGIVDVN